MVAYEFVRTENDAVKSIGTEMAIIARKLIY
jgi:hypothetical protein